MRLWLTRQANGLYMLTAKKPVWAPVNGTSVRDAYVVRGEPIGLRNICDVALKLFGLEEMRRGESKEVELVGSIAPAITTKEMRDGAHCRTENDA